MSADNPVEAKMNRAVVAGLKFWEYLVDTAIVILPSAVAEVAASMSKGGIAGKESIKSKLFAIQKVKSLGYSRDEIVAFGQEKVISMAKKEARSANYTAMTKLVFNIPGSQRELVQAQVERVRSLLKLTVEDYWDWWLGQMMAATDDEIRHSAGVSHHARAKDAPTKF
jgi:hypothetical protein